MKYLVLLAVLALFYFLWRKPRAGRPSDTPVQGAAPRLPQDMVRCAVCAVHLPQADAVPDRIGRFYCSAEHRRSAGD